MSPATPPAGIHAVGIDLGTTYSCISYLTPQGQPVTVPNQEGEMTTPSVVLFEGDEPIVGTEALRNAVSHPSRVVQHAKRFMGDPHKVWMIDGKAFRPEDISALILRKLLSAAEERLGSVIRQAVITVPAQFSDIQRQKTVEAGRKAGLDRVDIINEPVAASLCYVLGEGMWFAELANDQTVMVFDLGGGTFDLSLVKYNKDKVTVVGSGGDLSLGGLDWNKVLETYACEAFLRETPSDPRLDLETMQALSLEVEQAKRSLSARNKAVMTLQHAGRRKAIEIERPKFEQLAAPLVNRVEEVTRGLLRSQKLGWARIDAVLITGGATRMPMIRDMLKRISGTTINSTLSPDQSISHGAAYYAGMLLSGEGFAKSILSKATTSRLARFQQQSVCARGLGILVRDTLTGERTPHFLIAANTPLPCAFKQSFGTVVPNQRRVHLHIVESGTSPDQPYLSLGECVVEDLPEQLPELSPIEVTIWYDEQARVRVSAIEPQSGQAARATLVRPENVTSRDLPEEQPTQRKSPEARPPKAASPSPQPVTRVTAPESTPPARKKSGISSAKNVLAKAERPIPLCNECGEMLDSKGKCVACGKMFSFTSPVNTFRPASDGKTPVSGKLPEDPYEAPTEPMQIVPPASRSRKPGKS